MLYVRLNVFCLLSVLLSPRVWASWGQGLCLSYSLLYSQHLEKCLAQSWCSINICTVNEQVGGSGFLVAESGIHWLIWECHRAELGSIWTCAKCCKQFSYNCICKYSQLKNTSLERPKIHPSEKKSHTTSLSNVPFFPLPFPFLSFCVNWMFLY